MGRTKVSKESIVASDGKEECMKKCTCRKPVPVKLDKMFCVLCGGVIAKKRKQ